MCILYDHVCGHVQIMYMYVQVRVDRPVYRRSFNIYRYLGGSEVCGDPVLLTAHAHFGVVLGGI